MPNRTLPPDWTLMSLASTALAGKTGFDDGDWIESPYIAKSGIRLIQTGNIGVGAFVDKPENKKFISQESFHVLRCKWVLPGDLLICRLADPIGRACIVPESVGASITSVDCTIYRPSPDKADVAYMLHHLNSREYLTAAADIAGGTTRQRISRSNLGGMSVPLPPLREQRRIAEILDTLDETILQTEQLIAKLQQVKQGLIHDLLTRGIDENGELRDPERHPEQFQEHPVLGRIPKVWEYRELGQVAVVDRGKFTHRPRNDPRFYGGRYPFIQTGDITGAIGEVLTTYSQTLNERGIGVSKSFPTGSIAVTIAANIADTCILGLEMYFPDSVVGVVPVDCDVRFVELCIRREKPRLEAKAPQSAQKNINLQDLRPLPMPWPTLGEQKSIAAVYEALADRIRTEKRELQKLKLLKAGLMDDLLTGRVRVPVDDGGSNV